jgi:7,8-dihydro-6-hydroxymethylpterin-pyrophosphokinase
MGRVKVIDKGPRNIDLDILLYDDQAVSNERLQIPHKLMLEREFVLRPLCEYVYVVTDFDPWTLTNTNQTNTGRKITATLRHVSSRRLQRPLISSPVFGGSNLALDPACA